MSAPAAAQITDPVRGTPAAVWLSHPKEPNVGLSKTLVLLETAALERRSHARQAI